MNDVIDFLGSEKENREIIFFIELDFLSDSAELCIQGSGKFSDSHLKFIIPREGSPALMCHLFQLHRFLVILNKCKMIS